MVVVVDVLPPDLVVVVVDFGDAAVPNARNFRIITSSAFAAGSSASTSPPSVMYGPTVGNVSALSDPGGKLWNSVASLISVPSVRVWSIVRLWAAALMKPFSAIGLVISAFN